MILKLLTEKKIPASKAATVDQAADYLSADVAGELAQLQRGGAVDYELPETIGERPTGGLSFMVDLIDDPVAHVAVSSLTNCQCPVYASIDKQDLGGVEAAESIAQVIGWALGCAEGEHLPAGHAIPAEPGH